MDNFFDFLTLNLKLINVLVITNLILNTNNFSILKRLECRARNNDFNTF